MTKEAWKFTRQQSEIQSKTLTSCDAEEKSQLLFSITFSPSPPSARLLPISTLDWLRRPPPHPRSSFSPLDQSTLRWAEPSPPMGLKWRDPKLPAAPLSAMRRAAGAVSAYGGTVYGLRTADGPLWVLGALCQPIGRERRIIL